MEELAAHFAGRACGGILDLFVGYDERSLAESSRDLTTFQTLFGALRLVTLPMADQLSTHIPRRCNLHFAR